MKALLAVVLFIASPAFAEGIRVYGNIYQSVTLGESQAYYKNIAALSRAIDKAGCETGADEWSKTQFLAKLTLSTADVTKAGTDYQWSYWYDKTDDTDCTLTLTFTVPLKGASVENVNAVQICKSIGD